MKYLSLVLLSFVSLLSGGCGTIGVTSAQAVAIGQPLVSGGLQLILSNNPSYIPIAQKVGGELATADWTDLTITGINVAVTAAVNKEGGSPALGAILSGAVDAGLAGYLESVGEASLAKDPNAVYVLQALGQAIVTGANAAQAYPKPVAGPPAPQVGLRYFRATPIGPGMLGEVVLTP